MIIDDRHYDFIVIGSGAGGGTLAGALTRTGHFTRVGHSHASVLAAFQKLPPPQALAAYWHASRIVSHLPADEYQRKRREKLGLPQPDDHKRLSSHEKSRATGCMSIVLDEIERRERGEQGESDEWLLRELRKVRGAPSNAILQPPANAAWRLCPSTVTRR